MEDERNTTKQILQSILGVCILVIAVIGVSFAAFNYSRTGETTNVVTTGKVIMNYSEAENGINIVNAQPTEDRVGIVLNGENNVFDFTVSVTLAKGVNINYAITAVKEEGSNLKDESVKLYLTSSNDTVVEKAPTLMSMLDKIEVEDQTKSGAPVGQYILKQGTFSTSQIDHYRLRMWLDSGYDSSDQTLKTYKIRVNVYGAAAD